MGVLKGNKWTKILMDRAVQRKKNGKITSLPQKAFIAK
jgi:hypothetical protein